MKLHGQPFWLFCDVLCWIMGVPSPSQSFGGCCTASPSQRGKRTRRGTWAAASFHPRRPLPRRGGSAGCVSPSRAAPSALRAASKSRASASCLGTRHIGRPRLQSAAPASSSTPSITSTRSPASTAQPYHPPARGAGDEHQQQQQQQLAEPVADPPRRDHNTNNNSNNNNTVSTARTRAGLRVRAPPWRITTDYCRLPIAPRSASFRGP